MDLPTAWNPDDKSSYLSVDSSRLRLNYGGLGESIEDVGAIRANHPIPPHCKLFYFEVDIINEGKNKAIAIGFCEKTVNLNGLPGWYDDSWGYHGDDGYFGFSGTGIPYGPLFSTGDIIGCCLNFKNNTVFYTKNGINLGIAFRNLKGTLYPCVGLGSQGGSIEVNFGSRNFKFAETTSNDIGDELLKSKWIKAFHICINTTKIYSLEDLENSLKIKQDTAALKFRGKFNFIMGIYEDAIIDLTKLIGIEPNNKLALRYRAETYYLMEKYKESFNDVNKLLKIDINDEWASKLSAKIIEKDPCVDETYELGYFYLHGINVEKDEYKAFAQFEKSANMEHAEGINCLGYCYEYGIGVEKNENKAFSYYQKSADVYNPNGMYQVGYCYYLGIGVDNNKHKAFTYYLKSAEAGNSMGILKTVICYFYGIGVEQNKEKVSEWARKDPILNGINIIENEDILRNSKYGKCAYCNEDNTYTAWCQSCDPDIATRWTIRNKDIEDCLKKFQLRAREYEDVIEWIPFDRLLNIKKIGKGGFGSVYSATWLDGIRKVEKIKEGDNDIYKRAREPSSIVALKTLTSSKENTKDFLKEFKSFMECKLNCTKLAIYGITQNAETNEYLMVFQYANNGSLHKYLRKNFCTLTWQAKLKILRDISLELYMIHNSAGYIHADFHSGNILQDQQSYIADLGLSRKTNETVLTGDIHGVMPYVAPEVLLGEQQFTQAADIYGFGAIMSEMTTGQRPFDGYEFSETKLAVEICRGLRPEFAPETPKSYIELAKKCMNSDSQKRPSAWDVYKTFNNWIMIIASLENNEIKTQFLDADKVIKSLPISKHPDEIYTSQIISTKLISKAIKDDSTQITFNITET